MRILLSFCISTFDTTVQYTKAMTIFYFYMCLPCIIHLSVFSHFSNVDLKKTLFLVGLLFFHSYI